MNENEIKMQAHIFDLQARCSAHEVTISELRSMNEFLRSIINKLVDNVKD